MIVDAKIKKYANSDFVHFIGEVVNLAKSADKPILEPQIKALEEVYAQINAALSEEEEHQGAVLVRSLDLERDDALHHLRDAIAFNVHHAEEVYRNAANALLKCFDKYGSQIAQMNYKVQTAVVQNLIRDFEKYPELAAAIKLLDINDKKEALKYANETFDKQYSAKSPDATIAKSILTIPELRPQTMLAYRNLIDRIKGRAAMHRLVGWDEIIRQFNELINLYDAKIAPATE